MDAIIEKPNNLGELSRFLLEKIVRKHHILVIVVKKKKKSTRH